MFLAKSTYRHEGPGPILFYRTHNKRGPIQIQRPACGTIRVDYNPGAPTVRHVTKTTAERPLGVVNKSGPKARSRLAKKFYIFILTGHTRKVALKPNSEQQSSLVPLQKDGPAQSSQTRQNHGSKKLFRGLLLDTLKKRTKDVRNTSQKADPAPPGQLHFCWLFALFRRSISAHRLEPNKQPRTPLTRATNHRPQYFRI